MKKILSISLTIILLSCEKDLPAELPLFEPAIVVNSVIRPDTAVYVSLSVSENLLSDLIPKTLTGATIQLFEDDSFIGTLKDSVIIHPEGLVYFPNMDPLEKLKGIYYLDYVPKQSSVYRLEVDHPDYPSVSASTSIPVQVSDFEITLSDPLIEQFLNPQSQMYEPYRVEYTASIKIRDTPSNDFYGIAVISEVPFSDYIFDENGEITGKVTFDHWSEQFFESNDPVFDLSKNPVIPEDIDGFDEFFDNSKVFSDKLFENQEYTIEISFNLNVGPAVAFYEDGNIKEILSVFERFYIEVRSLSEEYYNYQFTSLLQKSIQKDPFAEPVQVYDNIEGGHGIFAGFNVETFEFSLEEFIPN